MESLKKVSAARIVQVSLNILWIISIIIGGGMLVLFVFICFLPEYDPGGWTILLDPGSIKYSIDPMVEGLSKVRLETGQFEMGFSSPTRAGTIIFQFARVIIGMFILLKILYLSRKIAFTWPDKSPFSLKNIQRLRSIGFYFIVIPLFASLDLITTHYFLASKFDFPVDPGFFINWDLGMVGNILSRFKWEYFLFGVGILALAEVFNTGLEFQEDSSSIL